MRVTHINVVSGTVRALFLVNLLGVRIAVSRSGWLRISNIGIITDYPSEKMNYGKMQRATSILLVDS